MLKYLTLNAKYEQVLIGIGFIFLFYFQVANNLLLLVLGCSILFIHARCLKIMTQLNVLEDKIMCQKEDNN